MNNKTLPVIGLVIVAGVFLMSADGLAQRRGGGGFRGGGGGMRGGGMSRPSMGGGSRSYSRPSVNRSSSFSRPSQPIRSGGSYRNPSAGSRAPANRSATTARSGQARSRTPGSVQFPRSGGNRQIGSVDRTPANRLGNRQIGGVDRTPGNRVGDRKLGAVDRTPGNRVGDRKLGAVDRTPRNIVGRAAIPGLATGAIDGSRLSGDLQSQLSSRRSQFQQNRADGNFRDGLQSRYENRGEMVADRRANMQSRLEDRQSIIDDRQEHRETARNDRQDYRDGAREDWQDWADHNHWDDHWGSGHWAQHFEDHWDYMWDNYPVYSAFRVTAWGVNRASYLFGWGSYANPYVSGGVVGDSGGGYYSEPLVSDAPLQQYVTEDVVSSVAATDTADAAPVDSAVPDAAVESFDQARAQFKQGQYSASLTAVNAAVELMPKDAALHEFRSLALFALGRYQESAAAIHAVLAVGPSWNWTTMSELYGSTAAYTEQLRALELHTRNNPETADCRLLLSYHYLTCGHRNAAKAQLEKLVTLQPEDSVAKSLLTMLTGSSEESAPPPVVAQGPQAEEADLIGSWTSSRVDGTKFELTLTKEGEFTWSHSGGSKASRIRGVFAVADGVLAMQPDSGGVMAANVNLDDKGFRFSQVGQSEAPIVFLKK